MRLAKTLPLLLSLAWSPAGAYNWNTGYGANLSQGWDDNYRLSEVDEISTGITTLGLFTDLTGSTEISALRFALAASANWYSDSTIEDSDNTRISFGGTRQGERWSGDIDLGFASESTTETELLDTGRVIDGSRETTRIAPVASYRMDERNSLSLSYEVRDVSYDTVSLVDYVDNAAAIAWNHNLNETNFLRTSLYGSVYDPEDDDTTQVKTFDIGYWWNADPVTSYGFTLGYSRVERPDEADSSGVYSADVNREIDENNQLSATLANSYQDSGAGEVRDETQLTVRWLHALSARSRLNLSVDGRSNDFRDYLGIQFGSSYSYTREISLGASVRHQRQDLEGGRKSDSNSVFFTLAYSTI